MYGCVESHLLKTQAREQGCWDEAFALDCSQEFAVLRLVLQHVRVLGSNRNLDRARVGLLFDVRFNACFSVEGSQVLSVSVSYRAVSFQPN